VGLKGIANCDYEVEITLFPVKKKRINSRNEIGNFFKQKKGGEKHAKHRKVPKRGRRLNKWARYCTKYVKGVGGSN